MRRAANTLTLAEPRRRRPAASLPLRRQGAPREIRKVESKVLVPLVRVADLHIVERTSPEFYCRRRPPS
jgi:hypothetical protein